MRQFIPQFEVRVLLNRYNVWIWDHTFCHERNGIETEKQAVEAARWYIERECRLFGLEITQFQIETVKTGKQYFGLD